MWEGRKGDEVGFRQGGGKNEGDCDRYLRVMMGG